MKQEQINILKYRSFSEGVISNYSYDNTWQLYDYIYAFFYGFVQNINYIYDDKTIKIGELLSFIEYTYDYSIASMMLGGNKGYSWASQSTAPSHALTSQGNNFNYTSTTLITGFGARYYDSDISVWLSVDPLADKYPSMSPFMYVLGNPIALIDPNGMASKPPKLKLSRQSRRRVRRYKRKANRLRKKYGLSWKNNRNEIHSLMNDKYKGRKFMSVEESDIHNNSLKSWYSTSSVIDALEKVFDIIPSENIRRTQDWVTSRWVEKNQYKEITTHGNNGNITLALRLIDKSLNYPIKVLDSKGNRVVSGDLSKGAITFSYGGVQKFILIYSPTLKATEHSYGKQSESWSRPVINIVEQYVTEPKRNYRIPVHVSSHM